MAAGGSTPIQLYHSATASAAPLAINLVAGELALNTNDGILYYKDSTGVVQVLAEGVLASHLSWNEANQTLTVDSTGSLKVPVGNTAQQPATPASGMLRFNTTSGQFEGYNGSVWGGIGGAQAGGAIITNTKQASSSYTITTLQNGFSVGPITIASGVTITVATDSRWVII
jgi:hypothetical protein